MLLLTWLKRRTCGHNRFHWYGILPKGFRAMEDFTWIRDETLGVSLGWNAKPVVIHKSLCKCLRCGADFWTKPGYRPGGFYDTPRDENGWPLNEDGSKMEIYEGSK